jgi:hypothetical protein
MWDREVEFLIWRSKGGYHFAGRECVPFVNNYAGRIIEMDNKKF